MKQVVILAGGKGTRLKERLGNLPKPLIDVCGTPLLEHQILLAKKYGFDRVLVLVNHKAEQILEFCKKRDHWGISVTCIDDRVPLGTAGAVLNVLSHLEDEFLVMYGDTMLDVDLERFCRAHRNVEGASATLFLHPNDHPHDSDLVEMTESGTITQFHPYPHPSDRYYPNLVNAALYCINKTALVAYQRHAETELDFGRHLFPKMIQDGHTLKGYNSPEYIKDCGTPERIDKVRLDFSLGKIANASLAKKQCAVFLDRDGTIIEERDHLRSPDQVELLDGAASAIRGLNRNGYKTCVVTNQPVIARGECSIDELRQIHNKLETLLGRESAYLDRIYYCPHHPDKGFAGEIAKLKMVCQCRKPHTGMIDTALLELNIDPMRSWLIGDTTTDILTAKRARLKSVLVETGHAGQDGKYQTTADFVVPSLSAAADLILDTYPNVLERYSSEFKKIKAGDVIFIGGQSRSGKSTFARIFQHALHGTGQSCHVISTDRWILSEVERKPGVLGRHAMVELNHFLTTISERGSQPMTVLLPMYWKQDRRQQKEAESLTFQKTDVVVVEGVVSLASDLAKSADHLFFVDVDEALRKRRILEEYQRRGYSLGAAMSIYEDRLAEEVPIIDRLRYNAKEVKLSQHID
jgi:histidinol-phosphate phosphatase family protein